jgi:transcription initiation factor IIF auxiliary subunit
MEKLAEGLERLGEDDLLHVVQLVHDNKTEETYTKNDVESEFDSNAVASGH